MNVVSTAYHIFCWQKGEASAYWEEDMNIADLRAQINDLFVGKEDVVEDVLVCLLAGGHVLLEDVPGVGKTMLAKTLSKTIGADFGRIQFTPDTLPSDVTGASIYNLKTGEFAYHQGAIMHEIVLADEINRTSPKTQASLLEAMAERQVTVDGKAYPLPELFMVIATQNPVEYLGTYPLPEAQMDRFMMRLTIGYPSEEAELRMTRNHIDGKVPEHASALCTAADIVALKQEVEKVHVSDALISYIRNIVELTRRDERFVTGASPRALLAIMEAARAKAFLSGRDFVKPDDVKAVARNVLHHRLELTSDSKIRGEDVDKVLISLIPQAKIPME